MQIVLKKSLQSRFGGGELKTGAGKFLENIY